MTQTIAWGLYIIGSVIFLGCSSSSRQVDEKSTTPPSRSRIYRVEAFSMKSDFSKNFQVEEASDLTRERTMLIKALTHSGWVVSPGGPLKIQIRVDTEKPVLGLNIGTLNGYRHSFYMKGIDHDNKTFEVKVIGVSEYRERDQVLAQLIGLAVDYMGRNTKGLEQVHMADDDLRATRAR